VARFKKIYTGVTEKQTIEFGLVCILFSTFFALHYKSGHFVLAAFILSLITIIVPRILYPFALCWFGLSKIMGSISSRVILSLVFFLIVVPVGFIRKLSGKDNLKINQFKKNRETVMKERNHQYNSSDIQHGF
jgi:hypothetical protein